MNLFPCTRPPAPENRRGETIDLKRMEPLAAAGKDVTVSNDGSALPVNGQCPLFASWAAQWGAGEWGWRQRDALNTLGRLKGEVTA